jgi:hypothetical protein
MYGVPANLDLTRFIDATLEQICIGQYQIQFHFHPVVSISVEGDWRLQGPAGNVVDQSQENVAREAYRLHHLLGKRVVRASVDPPRSLTLHFECGHELWVFDNSERFESFSIQPGDIFV